MAKRKPSDIHLAEVHDCFTIAEVCAIEELGLVPRGQGGDAARSGLTARDGRSPVNTSGGLKSKGHPVGATGVAQINEVVTQLRGEAGERQVRERADRPDSEHGRQRREFRGARIGGRLR